MLQGWNYMSHLNNFFTFFPFTFELTWTIFYNVFYNSTNHIFLHGFFGFYIINYVYLYQIYIFLYHHLSIYLCLYVLSYNLIICLPYWLLIQSEKNSKTQPLLLPPTFQNFEPICTSIYLSMSVLLIKYVFLLFYWYTKTRVLTPTFN
jgi:hypothetical protein